jgi:hypothetical protein
MMSIVSNHSSRSHSMKGPAGALALVIASLALFGTFDIASPPAWADGAPTSLNSQQRVKELEERVKILELEHETLDRRMRLETERSGRAVEDLDKRLRALEGRAVASEAPAAPMEKSAAREVNCTDPYIDVGHGIRRVKPGCESSGNECDAPEAIDGRGVRTILPACVQTIDRNKGNCEPPHFIDYKGVKRFKPECM